MGAPDKGGGLVCKLWIGWLVFEKCNPQRRTTPKVGGRGGENGEAGAGSQCKVTQAYSQVVQNKLAQHMHVGHTSKHQVYATRNMQPMQSHRSQHSERSHTHFNTLLSPP